MRFYLIDRVNEVCPEKYIEAVKCISMSEDVFNEHFPGYPLFPGSLVLEGLAQMSGLFLEFCLKRRGMKSKRAALTLVNRMKYREAVRPGDRLIYRGTVKVFYPDDGYAVMKVEARCDEKLYAEGELMFGFLDLMSDEMEQATESLMKMAFTNAKIVENR